RDSRHHPRSGGRRRRMPRRVERSAGAADAGRPHSRDARRRVARRAVRRCERGAGDAPGGGDGPAKARRGGRGLRTLALLARAIAFFTWYLWPDGGRPHPFLNGANALLILKYSSIYGIAAIGAAMVIISGGIDLAPGAVIALTGVVAGALFVDSHWSLGGSAVAGIAPRPACV